MGKPGLKKRRVRYGIIGIEMVRGQTDDDEGVTVQYRHDIMKRWQRRKQAWRGRARDRTAGSLLGTSIRHVVLYHD
jgi:hypothetical protein